MINKTSYPLLVSWTKFERVFDSLLVLPVSNVDQPNKIFVAKTKLPRTARARHVHAVRARTRPPCHHLQEQRDITVGFTKKKTVTK